MAKVPARAGQLALVAVADGDQHVACDVGPDDSCCVMGEGRMT